MKGIIISLALCFLFCVSAVVADTDIKKTRVLVLLDNLAIKSTHSEFFNQLKDNGYIVDIKPVNSVQYKLKEFGEYNYDHLILFCTSESELKSIKTAQILEFFDDGGNVLLAGDVDTSRIFRQLTTSLGVEFDHFGSKVYDDTNAIEAFDASLFGSTNLINQAVFSERLAGPVLFRGIGHTLSVFENFQVYGVLRGTPTTYSRLSAEKTGQSGLTSEIVTAGQNVVLVSAIQGRNNARVVVTGSLDLFSNELFVKSNGINRKFSDNIIAWNFQESGLLRVSNVKHFLQGDKKEVAQFSYKVMDDVSYRVDITTWNRTQKQWVPYVADDVVLEFVMLDPYIRAPLKHVPKTSTYMIDFKIPDKYGVFTFKVVYRKPGYSFVASSTVVPVRPFLHNEYERFLSDASPYYVTVFVTLVGFFVFVLFFLFDSSGKRQ